jgi:hypothetical protein
MLRAVENLLHAHLENDFGMRADPRALGRHVEKHGIEHCPRLSVMDWIDPHQNPVDSQKLLAHLVGDIVGIDRWLGVDAKRSQFLEDTVKAVVLRRCGASCLAVTPPQHRDPVGLRVGHLHPPEKCCCAHCACDQPQIGGFCPPGHQAVQLLPATRLSTPSVEASLDLGRPGAQYLRQGAFRDRPSRRQPKYRVQTPSQERTRHAPTQHDLRRSAFAAHWFSGCTCPHRCADR